MLIFNELNSALYAPIPKKKNSRTPNKVKHFCTLCFYFIYTI